MLGNGKYAQDFHPPQNSTEASNNMNWTNGRVWRTERFTKTIIYVYLWRNNCQRFAPDLFSLFSVHSISFRLCLCKHRINRLMHGSNRENKFKLLFVAELIFFLVFSLPSMNKYLCFSSVRSQSGARWPLESFVRPFGRQWNWFSSSAT